MNYSMGRLPGNTDEFSSLIHEYRKSAEGAVAGCIAALNIMAENYKEGRKAMMMLHPETSETTMRLAGSQLGEAPWLVRSYFTGTSPENGYEITGDFSMDLSKNPYSGSPEDGSVKFFVACSGADSPRPVTVARRDNYWYPREWSSLIVGIKKPCSH